ncbi:MAG: hypothetical protein CMF52_04770 [Legionellales bacterium]|nr:hypothetical protein [Legionellales bacterium]
MLHDSLENLYKTNFALMQHHKYSLTELENMIPWERDVYVNLLLAFLQEEERRRAAENNRNRVNL